MEHLISLLRVQDGNVSAVKIEKAYVDTEHGHRFRELLENIRDKVHANTERHFGNNVDSVYGYPTWTWRSTRKQKVEYLSLGNTSNFPTSRCKAPLVCSHRIPCLSAHDPGHAGDPLEDFAPALQGQGTPTDALVLPVVWHDNSTARITTRTSKTETLPWGTYKLQTILVETIDDDYNFCENPWTRSIQGHFL